MKTFVFPGQGSQFVGMGKNVFDLYPDLVSDADEVLGCSIKELCLEDPNRVLNETQFTQPAIYVVNALKCRQHLELDDRRPDFVAGHSLGEYSALYVAGVVDFLTGLRLVVKRARLMSQATGGGMLAVIGMQTDRVQSLLVENGFAAIDVANFNSPRQVVLSGSVKDIRECTSVLEKAGAEMVVPLRVSGAFHSRYMQSASVEFERYVRQLAFNRPSIPTIANVTADLYTEDKVADLLVEQLVHPVRWVDTIRRLMAFQDMVFEEIGEGKMLTKLIGYIRAESQPCEHLVRSTTNIAK